MDRDFWEAFTNLYKQRPCIWNSKLPDYTNKKIREHAYADLLDFCKTRFPQANKDYIVKKIHSFRCGFRREHKKVKDSRKSGLSPDDIYVPSLWYYDQLLFIADLQIPRRSRNSNEDESADDEDQHCVEDEDEDEDLGGIVRIGLENSQCGSRKTVSARHVTKRRLVGDVSEGVNLCSNNIRSFYSSNEEDEFDVAGKKVAIDLRNLDPRQRVFVEKLISDVVYYGKLGKLCESSQIQLLQSNSNSYSQPRIKN